MINSRAMQSQPATPQDGQLASASLAQRVEERIRRALETGATPQIILDLDGTLFDNTPRTKTILVEQSAHLFGAGAEITSLLRQLPQDGWEYSPVDTLKKVGVEDPATLLHLREAWAAHFFGSGYLHHDEPLAGAVEAALAWWRGGAELNYMTGRHVPEMFLGTCRSLHDSGFPIGTIRTQLLMKPRFDASDVAFKVETIPAIRTKGPIVLIVDNDPRVLNPLALAAPEAAAVMVRTLHPKDAPPVSAGIVLVEDFRALRG